uniref:Retrovirus-related Pol polyprotein from transposon RE1 n=1 Tax=Vitis vinifera TaxID=29760 RepID=A5B6L3_VITVI|nr:hypothetical protein VITISV_028658 [Vitis vinifera]
MADVNQTTREVLHLDPSAETRRGNPTTTDESLRMAISPLSQLITMRLEDDNFLMWKYQIENVVRGYGLEGFLFGTEQVPPKMVNDGTGILVPNPKFRDYQRQDHLLISWLLSSIGSAFLPQVVGCSSAFEVWNTISHNFNSQSSAKVMFYKSQMHMLKKDGLTMRDYLTKMKNYCDLLATAGHKISDTDHILAIMQGLGDEYESVIAVISSKKSSPSLQYVTSTLIAHEGRIAHKISSNDLSVNYTSQYSNRGSSSSWNSNGYPSSGFQNRNQFGGNQIIRGYNPNFHGNMPANGPTPGVLGSGARNGASGSISSVGNVNLTEYDAQEDQDYSKMEAIVATPEDLQNCCSFPDSGATNHVTHDLGNLNSGVEYNGNSKIHMGNGTGPEISHIGLSIFPSSSSPNKVLFLKNILRVPTIKKNLLSVSQFARDNNVYFEFHPKVYTVNLNVEEPNAFQEAISHPKWKEAMGEEFRALMKNKTWSLVSLPSNKTFVRCRWVFKLKRNPDGSISRYKARLVAKGYSQSIRQLDVNNAFLNGELQEEVYMDQPPGFDGRTNQEQKLVCKLHKALYGLKQAPRAWFDKLKISLQWFGFSSTKSDQSLFKPLDTHWKAIKRILRYLNGTTDLGIVLKPSETMNLVGFYDADWGSDVDDRRSTSGHCVFLGKSLVSWSSKKQHAISRSSTESLLSELQTKMTMVPVIWCDNISTVSLLANPVLHSKTKHMELDLYFVREKVMERKLVVNHVPTGDQVADVFTKPLSFRFFDKLRGKLTVTSLDLKNGD